MKKNRRILVLALLVVLTFNACGKKNTGTPEVSPTVPPTTTVTPEVTEPPVDENAGGTNEEAGALKSNAELDAFHKKVKELVGENYIPSMPYDAVTMEELFGIKADWYDAAIAEGPMMSTHVDKLIAIHATKGNLENVQNAMKKYHESVLADTMNYPMNINRIQGSIVETVGDYVLFVMVGNIDEMKYEKEEDMIAAYKEQNQLVIDAAKETLVK